jgi:hypothetical protein
VRISLDGRKPEGEWCSFNEPCGKGDGKKVAFQTPFPAKEAKSLHFMRDFIIVAPDNIRRVADLDGNLLRDEPDGYTLTWPTNVDEPVTVTFDKAPSLDERISCSTVGRRPEKGEAFKVLPMTDTVAQKLDEKMPPELRKRKREMNASLPAVQEMYREAYRLLVVDCHGIVGDDGQPLDFTSPFVKKAILDTLGSVLLGSFAMDRARILQRDKASSLSVELSD